MQNLPVEIASEIFGQACFDDKATGCSLTLTSKWFKNVVQSVRFTAISLYGPHQTAHFASMLDQPSVVHQVKHLFVSGVDIETEEMRRVSRNVRLRSQAIQLMLISKTEEDDKGENVEVGDPLDDPLESLSLDSFLERDSTRLKVLDEALNKIFQYLAPSIQTLFISGLHEISRVFPQVAMPNLVDFSFTSSSIPFTFYHPLPRLRRLHTDSLYGYGRHKDQVDFKSNAPMLEELRVTGISMLSACRFVRDIISHAHSLEGRLFSKTMKHVILQQSPPPYGAFDNNPYTDYNTVKTCLQRSANYVAEVSDARGSGFRIVLLPGFDIRSWIAGDIIGLSYTFHDARRDWNDVIYGGKGSWNDSGAIQTSRTS